MSLGCRAIRCEAKLLQRMRSSGAAVVLLGKHGPPPLFPRETVRNDKRPVVRYTDRRDFKRREVHQKRTSFSAAEYGCVIHSSPTRPNLLFTFRQNFH